MTEACVRSRFVTHLKRNGDTNTLLRLAAVQGAYDALLDVSATAAGVLGSAAHLIEDQYRDIEKLETLLVETLALHNDAGIRHPYEEDTDVSGLVSYPERLREVLK